VAEGGDAKDVLDSALMGASVGSMAGAFAAPITASCSMASSSAAAAATTASNAAATVAEKAVEEGAKQAAQATVKEVTKEAAKEAVKETAKEAAKSAAKETVKATEKVAAETGKELAKHSGKEGPIKAAYQASHDSATKAVEQANTALTQIEKGTAEGLKQGAETLNAVSKSCQGAMKPFGEQAFVQAMRGKFQGLAAMLQGVGTVTSAGGNAITTNKAADAQLMDISSKRLRALMEKFAEDKQEISEIIHAIMESKNQRVGASLKMMQAHHSTATKVNSFR
jgi:colicin import membrane protein